MEMSQSVVVNGLEKDEAFQEVVGLLDRMQRYKGKRYGSSWCKHGEAISIFGNVSRKFDRIENIVVDAVNNDAPIPAPDSEESLAETIGDLATYCVLWLVWVRQNRPDEFNSWRKRIINFEL